MRGASDAVGAVGISPGTVAVGSSAVVGSVGVGCVRQRGVQGARLAAAGCAQVGAWGRGLVGRGAGVESRGDADAINGESNCQFNGRERKGKSAPGSGNCSTMGMREGGVRNSGM
jgi:hypothetical protein